MRSVTRQAIDRLTCRYSKPAHSSRRVRLIFLGVCLGMLLAALWR